MRIRDLPQQLRPRERLQRFGPDSLSDAELLALDAKRQRVLRAKHERADAMAGFDPATGLQAGYGLAYHGATDAELLHQVGLFG